MRERERETFCSHDKPSFYILLPQNCYVSEQREFEIAMQGKTTEG